jgi:hypothetical protein
MGSSIPEYAAVTQLALFIGLNLMAISCVTRVLFGFWIPPRGYGPIGAVAYGAVLLAAEYEALVAKGRFKKIKEEFAGQPEANLRLGRRIVVIYSVGSLILAIVVPIVTRPPR